MGAARSLDQTALTVDRLSLKESVKLTLYIYNTHALAKKMYTKNGRPCKNKMASVRSLHRSRKANNNNNCDKHVDKSKAVGNMELLTGKNGN